MSDCCYNPNAVHWTPAEQARLVHGAVVVFSWAGRTYTGEVVGTLVEGDRHYLKLPKSASGWIWFEDCGAAHVSYQEGLAWGFGGALAELGTKGSPARQGVLL